MYLKRKITLPFTKKELHLYQDTTECYICRRKFIKKFAKDKNHQNVRDHCHYTGKYRSVTHSVCNLKFNLPKKISAVFCSFKL